MNNNFDQIVAKYFESLGIKPVYGVTLLMIIFSYTETKKLKIWDKIPFVQRLFAILTWIATILGFIASIVSLFDIHR